MLSSLTWTYEGRLQYRGLVTGIPLDLDLTDYPEYFSTTIFLLKCYNYKSRVHLFFKICGGLMVHKNFIINYSYKEGNGVNVVFMDMEYGNEGIR